MIRSAAEVVIEWFYWNVNVFCFQYSGSVSSRLRALRAARAEKAKEAHYAVEDERANMRKRVLKMSTTELTALAPRKLHKLSPNRPNTQEARYAAMAQSAFEELHRRFPDNAEYEEKYKKAFSIVYAFLLKTGAIIRTAHEFGWIDEI